MKQYRQYLYLILIILFGLQLSSCLWGLAIEHKHLTDRFYLTAPDIIEQLSISYHYQDETYFDVVEQTVYEVGYNSDFIIAKRHPGEWDTINRDITLYYLIDVNAVKKEREQFNPSKESYQMVYKNSNGQDSLGPLKHYTTQYSPKKSEPLTYQEFEELRGQLKVPKELDFTIIYKTLE